MGTDGDAVLPVKWESPSSGGTETDYTPGEVNPWEDVLAARGIYPQRPAPDATIRKTVKLSQDGSDRMTFEDVENAPVTLTALTQGGFDINNVVWDDPGGIVYDNDGLAVTVT